ncbi:YdiY family protein [bacterium]
MKKRFVSVFCLVCIFVFTSALYAGKWAQSLSLGSNITKGNTDTEQFSMNYKGGKDWDKKAKIMLGFAVNLAMENDVLNTENYSGLIQYNRYISKRFYWLANSSYEIDKMADLNRRFLLGPGLGLSIIKREFTNLDVELGISYLNTQYENKSARETSAFRIAESYKWKITEKSKLWQTAEYITESDNTKAYLFNSEIGISTNIAGNLSIKSFALNKYNNVPDIGKKRNDLQFSTMLVYSF